MVQQPYGTRNRQQRQNTQHRRGGADRTQGGGNRGGGEKQKPPVAAVPAYLANTARREFAETPPGHRFSLYFQVWNEASWQLEKTRKADALKQVLQLPAESAEQLQALCNRQRELIASLPEESRFSLDATSISPFATGLGMEHPLENGFAFLNPYGHAYLPGSSIKGVLRRAAEELALLESDNEGWTLARVWWLLGFDASSEIFGQKKKDPECWKQSFAAHCESLANSPELVEWIRALAKSHRELQKSKYDERPADFLAEIGNLKRDIHARGALACWDALPKPAQNTLGMDVMTPHYSDYYQGNSTPHDAGQPNPIVFLVVPPGSEFSFHVTCHSERLPQSLRQQWKALVQAAFEHAFAWLGFGAKTAVGYGAMESKAVREEGKVDEHRKAETETIPSNEEPWPQATLTLDPGRGEITASFQGKKTAPLPREKAQALMEQLTEQQRQRLKKKKSLTGVAVRVRRLGNMLELLGIEGSDS